MPLKRATAIAWFALISISLIGCWRNESQRSPLTNSGPNKSPAEESAASAGESTVEGRQEGMATQRLISIGSFRGRDHTITIYTTSDGPRFTVTSAGGKVLAEKLSAGEIEAELPDIYKTYKNTFAASDNYLDARASQIKMAPAPATGRPYLDAGIDAQR